MVTVTVPNEFKYEKGIGAIDFSSDAHALVLLDPTYIADEDAHGTYDDIDGDEVANGYGYTTGGLALSVSSAWAQDNANDRARIVWSDLTITASGGAIGDFCAAAIINDDHASKVVVMIIELGETISLASGQSYQFKDMAYKTS
jgi:hypothetical protein